MRTLFLSMTFLLGCPPTDANPTTAAPAIRGYSFLICTDPLNRELAFVDVKVVSHLPGTTQPTEKSLRLMGAQNFCASAPDPLAPGVPMYVKVTLADMTVARSVQIVYPSPDHRAGDDSATNVSERLEETDENGAFVFLVIPETRATKTIRMGTVRPGEPLTSVFPPIEPSAVMTTGVIPAVVAQPTNEKTETHAPVPAAPF